MLHSKHLIITILIFFSFSKFTLSQVNLKGLKSKELKSAIILYNDKEFLLASEKIESYRRNEKGAYDDTLALRLLAECYWKLRSYKLAKLTYDNLLIASKSISPISKLHLSQLNAMNENYDIASRFLVGMDQEKDILYGFQNTKQFFLDSLDYNVQQLDNKNNLLNKKTISPVLYGDSLFWTMESPNLPILSMANLKEMKKNNYKKAKSKKSILLDEEPNSTIFNPVTISYLPGTKKVYFTIKNDVEDIHHTRIAEADVKGTSLKNLVTFSLGDGDYTMINPVISPDGTVLIFLSNKIDDQFDIYYCLLKDNHWTRPFPLTAINTPGDELFPIFDASGTLYFNSNGRAGLGGLDVYKVKLKIMGGDDIVQHLPYPINTSNDDFHFTTTDDGDKGYFISNRIGKDEFYYYDFKTKYIKVSGALLFNDSNKPIQDRSVLIYEKDLDGNWILKDSLLTDYDGKYQFKGRPNSIYKAVINDGPENLEMFIETHDKLQPLILESVLLEDRNKPKPINPDSVFNKFVINYEFGKSTLSNESKIVLDSLVKYLKENPTYYGVAASFTDCSGKAAYNLKLSALRSKAMLAYLKSKGIPESRLKESHFGNEFLINPCSETSYKSSTQTANRRTEVYVSRSNNKNWQQIHTDSTIKVKPINIDNLLNSSTSISNDEKKESEVKVTAPKNVETNINASNIANLPTTSKSVNRIPSAVISKTDSNTAVSKPSNKLLNATPANTNVAKSTYRTINAASETVSKPLNNETTESKTPVSNVTKEIPTADFYIKPKVNPVKSQIVNPNPVNAKTQVYTYTEKPVENLPKDDANKLAVRSFLSKQYASNDNNIPTSRSNNTIKGSSNKIITNLSKSMSVINSEQDRIREYLTQRENKKSIMVNTFSDSVFIEVYDNGVYDHDTISVIFNNQLVVDRQEIGTNVKDPVRFSLKLSDDPLKNQMVIVAENLGTEPPNSALLIIHDKLNNQKKIYLTTDLLHNEVVYFINLNKN